MNAKHAELYIGSITFLQFSLHIGTLITSCGQSVSKSRGRPTPSFETSPKFCTYKSTTTHESVSRFSVFVLHLAFFVFGFLFFIFRPSFFICTYKSSQTQNHQQQHKQSSIFQAWQIPAAHNSLLSHNLIAAHFLIKLPILQLFASLQPRIKHRPSSISAKTHSSILRTAIRARVHERITSKLNSLSSPTTSKSQPLVYR
jgi:hypothetical protein